MRILYAIHQFFPDYRAGTEILTYHTAKGMREKGNAVAIFTGHPVRGRISGDEAADRYEYDRIPVLRVRYSNTWSIRPRNPMEAEYNNLFVSAHFREEIIRWRPEIVHFYHLQRISASAVDACLDLNVPMVYTATDYWPICPTNQLFLPDHSLCQGPDGGGTNCIKHLAMIYGGKRIAKVLEFVPPAGLKWMSRFSRSALWPPRSFPALAGALTKRHSFMRDRLNRVDAILVQTALMKEMLSKHGIEKGRIHRFPFGIDDFTVRRTGDKGKGKILRVGFIGTLYEHKGAHVLIGALKRLPRQMPLEVLVYGDLDQFPRYAQDLVRLAGDDPRIRFCGTFANEKIGEILDGMDILVVPSLWYENGPLVIFMAQRARVPVVAADVDGIAEFIRDGENGILFRRNDDRSLAEILSVLCRERDAVVTMSRKAPVPRSLSSYLDGLEDFYLGILGKRFSDTRTRPGKMRGYEGGVQ